MLPKKEIRLVWHNQLFARANELLLKQTGIMGWQVVEECLAEWSAGSEGKSRHVQKLGQNAARGCCSVKGTPFSLFIFSLPPAQHHCIQPSLLHSLNIFPFPTSICLFSFFLFEILPPAFDFFPLWWSHIVEGWTWFSHRCHPFSQERELRRFQCVSRSVPSQWSKWHFYRL